MKTLLRLYTDAYRGLPREIWMLSAVLFVNRSGAMVLTFLTLYLTKELGYSLTVAGQVLAVYGLGHLVGAILGGWLCDRLGALRIQFLSLALSGLGLLVLESLRQVGAFMAVTFFVAVAPESFRPANLSALAAFSPPELQTRAVALNRMALNLGFSVGPAVGGVLAARDYSLLFWVDGATCLAAALILKLLFRGRRPAASDAKHVAAGAAEIHPLRDRAFLAFLGLVFLFTLVFFQNWSTYPVYLNDVYGIAEAQFGLLMTLNGLMIFAFEMILTHRAERYRPLTVIGAGVFLSGLGLAVLPLATLFALEAPSGATMALALGSVAIWTMGEMLGIPASGGWIAKRAGVTHRGKYMGLYTMVWGLGFTIGPPVGAWLYQVAGPEVLWLVVGLLGGITWLGCEALHRAIEKSEAARSPLPGEKLGNVYSH